MRMRSKFKRAEWKKVTLLPLSLFYHTALVDGYVADEEVDAFFDYIRRSSQLKEPLTKEIFTSYGFGSELAAMKHDAVKLDLNEVKGILRSKLTRDEYEMFCASICYYLPVSIARAESGIDQDEAETISRIASCFDLDPDTIERWRPYVT